MFVQRDKEADQRPKWVDEEPSPRKPAKVVKKEAPAPKMAKA